MKNKNGGGWTVNKLIMIILFVLILVILIAGGISGGLTPLFEKLGNSSENVLEKLKGVQDSRSEFSKDCLDWKDAIEISPEAQFRFCNGHCEIKLKETDEESLDKGTFKYDNGKLYDESSRDISELTKYDQQIILEWNTLAHQMVYGETWEEETKQLIDELNNAKKYFQATITEVVLYRINKNTYELEILEDRKWKKDWWKIKIGGAPWLNPAIPIDKLEQYKKINDYMVKNCN